MMTTNEIARDITRRRPLYAVSSDNRLIDAKTGIEDEDMAPSAAFTLSMARRLNGEFSKDLGVWRSMQAHNNREFSHIWETGLLSWLGIHRRFRFKWSSTMIGEYVGRTRQIGWLTWWSYREAS